MLRNQNNLMELKWPHWKGLNQAFLVNCSLSQALGISQCQHLAPLPTAWILRQSADKNKWSSCLVVTWQVLILHSKIWTHSLQIKSWVILPWEQLPFPGEARCECVSCEGIQGLGELGLVLGTDGWRLGALGSCSRCGKPCPAEITAPAGADVLKHPRLCPDFLVALEHKKSYFLGFFKYACKLEVGLLLEFQLCTFFTWKGFYEPSQTSQTPPELGSPLFLETFFVFSVQAVDLARWFWVGHFYWIQSALSSEMCRDAAVGWVSLHWCCPCSGTVTRAAACWELCSSSGSCSCLSFPCSFRRNTRNVSLSWFLSWLEWILHWSVLFFA